LVGLGLSRIASHATVHDEAPGITARVFLWPLVVILPGMTPAAFLCLKSVKLIINEFDFTTIYRY